MARKQCMSHTHNKNLLNVLGAIAGLSVDPTNT